MTETIVYSNMTKCKITDPRLDDIDDRLNDLYNDRNNYVNKENSTIYEIIEWLLIDRRKQMAEDKWK